ncbi:helix-turn-helix domain-containing protein [Micrococcus terreus]|uniref:PucR family transcriptional regulator n=1 Tax=Micrococcus terreus TaxID=574650 RepID=UPI0033C7F5C0
MQHTPPPPLDWSPPWESLPSDLSVALAPAVPEIVKTIIETVPQQIPAYAAARADGRHGDKLTLGVITALDQLLALPGTSRPALTPESRALVADLGAGEFRQGRSMDALLAAYRTSARIAFRGLSEECARQQMDLSVVVDLGESIWAYIDELSSVSAQAYAFEQSARAGVLELRRADLVGALVRGGLAEDEVHRLSAAADWRLPRRLAVVVMPVESAPAARTALGHAGLVVERESEATALVSAPERSGQRTRLLRLLAGLGAVVGPSVDWQGVPHSYRVALTLSLQRGAAGPDGAQAPILAEDHLSLVVLGAEPLVMQELAERALAPLAGQSEAKREVLEQTLLSWLRHWGQRAPVAEELGIHPQTVGYRLGRLRELFGEALEDPETRFDLELALRWQTLTP